MFPKSIRGQLPLTYAGIALLAALALGTGLLITLRGYYSQQELDYLKGNTQAIGQTLGIIYSRGRADFEIQAQVKSLSFLSQSRIRVLNNERQTIADSGSFQNRQLISLNYDSELNSENPPAITYAIDTTDRVSLEGNLNQREQIEFFPLNSAPLWNEKVDRAVDAVSLPPQSDFVFAVAGTPFGFGLNLSTNFNGRSDQRVEIPFTNGNQQVIGYVELSEGPAYGSEIVAGVAKALIGTGMLAVLVAGGVGWFVSQRMSKPLQALTETTGQMAHGNLAARVKMERQDEFGRLAKSFNEMASRVEHTVTTLKRFVADAAHELHTPLTAVHAHLELAATEVHDEQRREFLQQARLQLSRLEILTNNLLDLSRIEAGTGFDERVMTDLTSLIRETSELYASRAEQKDITFEFETGADPVMGLVHEGQVRRVFCNLLDNAIKFTPEKGYIRVGVGREKEQIHIWVKDSGIGIPVEDLPHLFSRFRRGRNAMAYPGSGLGLAIIKAIVEGHRGEVRVESEGQGTQFWVQFPAMG